VALPRLRGFINMAAQYPVFAQLAQLDGEGVLVLVRSSRTPWRTYGASTRTDLTYALALDSAIRAAEPYWEERD
jgi:hypothetical protein